MNRKIALKSSEIAGLRKLAHSLLLLIISAYVALMGYVWHLNLKVIQSNLDHFNSSLSQGVRATLLTEDTLLDAAGQQMLALNVLEAPENGRAFMDILARSSSLAAFYTLSSADGEMILASGRGTGPSLELGTSEAALRREFMGTLSDSRLHLHAPYYDKSLGDYLVPLRKPVFNVNGELQLVVTVALPFDNLERLWSSSALPRHINSGLVLDNGKLIFVQSNDDQTSNIDKIMSSGNGLSGQLISDSDNYLSHTYLPEYRLHVGTTMTAAGVILNWVERMAAPSAFFLLFLGLSTWLYRRFLLSRVRSQSEILDLTAWQYAVLNSANYSIISTDAGGTIVSYNRAAERLFGYEPEEVIGKRTPVMFHIPGEIERRATQLGLERGNRVEPGFETLVAGIRDGKADESQCTLVRKDGSHFPAFLSITGIFSSEGDILGYLEVTTDLTEQETMRADLRDRELRYRALFMSASDAIFLVQDGHLVDCNPAALTLFKCKYEEIIGKNPIDLSPPQQPDGTPSSALAGQYHSSATLGEPQFFEWRHQAMDGSPIDTEVSLNLVEAGEKPLLLGIVRDITERHQLAQRLEYQARHDSLTGLPNRAMLHATFAMHRRVAEEAGHLLTLMLLDLDRFKEINDTLGHHIGDKVLLEIGPRLEHACPKLVTVARLGGDEFVVMANLTDTDPSVNELATRLVDSLREPVDIEGLKISVGASVGIACFPEHGQSSHDLLRAADVAMYRAKKLSLGSILYDDRFDNYSTQKLSFANELGQAAEQRQLVLHYQPKIDLASGSIAGFEALVRWQHPTQGLLYPDAFIDLVEMSEVLHPFTRAVIDIAVRDKKHLSSLGYSQPVAINLSARNLFDNACCDALDTALCEHQVNAREIEFELTESAFMHDPEHAVQSINQFHQRGIKIAIDDFGTGYSSLAYLRKIPVSYLKIDRAFVLDMTTNAQDNAIVRSTIALAHSLDLQVVAEGVEDDMTLSALRALHCEQAQGYGICRPQPLTELIEWLPSRIALVE